MKRIGWVSVIALFLLVSVFGFGVLSRQAARPSATPAVDARPIDQHAGHSDAAADSPATRSYKEANARMHSAMEIEYSGDADVDFMRGMIAHHEGAVEMSEQQVAEGQNPDAVALAEKIIADQQAEIAEMQELLSSL